MKKNLIIKNLIFDLGNVILDTEIDRTIFEFEKLGIKNIKNTVSFEENINFYFNFEKGLVSASDSRNLICKSNKVELTDIQFDKAWNAMLLSIDENKIDILKELKNKYRIFLLSNTNIIHYDCFVNQAYWQENLFEKKYYSHEIGMRKPDIDIFKFVLKDSNIKAEETYFIDDRKDNIDAAKKLNFNTILFQNIDFNEIGNILKNN